MEAKDTLNGQEPSWEQVTDVSDQEKGFLCNHVATTAAAATELEQYVLCHQWKETITKHTIFPTRNENYNSANYNTATIRHEDANGAFSKTKLRS